MREKHDFAWLLISFNMINYGKYDKSVLVQYTFWDW